MGTNSKVSAQLKFESIRASLNQVLGTKLSSTKMGSLMGAGGRVLSFIREAVPRVSNPYPLFNILIFTTVVPCLFIST